MATIAASKTAAAANAGPDPATLSARERIRLHVQRNIQQQAAAQQAKLQQDASTSEGMKKGAHEQSKPPPLAASRKRGYAAAAGESGRDGEGSPTWETNTPPSGLSIDAPPAKRSRAGGLYEGEEDDDYNEEEQDELRGSDSPPRGMSVSSIEAPIDFGTTMYTNPTENEDVEAPATGLGLCDSPPACEVSWNGSEVAAEPEANTSLNANGSHHHHPVDEDWVKGLYDMEGME